MSTVQISVHEGLRELKTLDARIRRATNEVPYVNIAKGKDTLPGYASQDDYIEKVKSSNQSLQALKNRRAAIKAAIVASNAVTKVTVANAEMTVAEAIERKSSIEYDKLELSKLKSDHQNALYQLERKNGDLPNRLDNLLEAQFGKEAKTKQPDEIIAQTTKSFMETNEFKLVDPLGILARIEELTRSIEDFEDNVDTALSISNAITKIEVPAS